MIEVIVAVAVTAILVVSIFPTVSDVLERRRLESAAKTLRELAVSIWAFRADVGVHAGALADLTAPIAVSGVNSCGVNYTTPNVNAWAGPYYTRQSITSSGLPLSSGRFGHAQNALVRTPSGVATPGTTSIVVTGVQSAAAVELNDLVDADGSSTTGRVRWGATDPQGFVTMTYHVAINGC